MAVCLESNSSYKIVSKNHQKPDKSLFLVKLTDSCLKTLEQLQNPTTKSKLAKNGATRKPSIQFKNRGKAGTLFIPSKNGTDNSGTKFNFTCTNLFMVNSTTGIDCLQQSKGDGDLMRLGNITEKITISANNDSYAATKNRMAEAEKEGTRAKVIELSKNGAVKKTKRIMPNPRQKFNFRKVNMNNKITQNSSSSIKGLREKVIHLLALRPCNKLELRLKVERDGAKLKDASVLTNILQQVSVMQDNVYVLNRHLYYTEVQVDAWPGYTDEDRETIRNKLVSEMGSTVDRLSPGPLASSVLGNNSVKRPLSGQNKPGMNPAGKKPRIAHTTQSTSKTDLKRSETSPPKLASSSPRTVPARRASKEKNNTKHETNKKSPSKEKGKTSKSKNGFENNNSNDSNNNNCAFSNTESSSNEDYILKYPEIKTYKQRCSYKEDFAKEYTEFTETKERLDLVTKQFNELKERLKQHPDESQAAKELQEEIFKLYEEKKERWAKDRQRLNYLYPKLSHIKKLVIQYDQAHFGTTKTPL